MTKHRTSALRADQPQPGGGIFGPDWHKWRGATLHVALEGEPPFLARFDNVSPHPEVASLTELDSSGRPVGIRTVRWPPPGTVRVLRSP